MITPKASLGPGRGSVAASPSPLWDPQGGEGGDAARLVQLPIRQMCACPSAGAVTTKTKCSLGADAGGLDHLAPARDVLREEFGEIFRGAALRRDDDEAELFEPLADVGIVERVAHRLVELAHDRLGRALGHEER